MKTFKTDVNYLKAIISNVKPWKGRYVAGLLASSSTGYLNALLLGLLMGGMLQFAQSGNYAGVLGEAAKWSALLAAALALEAAGNYWVIDASVKASAALKRRLFAHMLNLPYSVTNKMHTGDKLSRLDSDATLCADTLKWLLGTLAGAAVSFVLGLATVLVIDWRIALALVGVGVVMFLINIQLVRHSRKRYEQKQEQTGATISYMSDLLAGSGLVRIYGEDTGLMQRFRKSCENLYKKGIAANNVSAVYYGLNQVNAGLTTAASIGLGLIFYRAGYIEIALLPVLIQVASSVVKPLSDLSWTIIELQESLAGAKRVAEVLDEQEEAITAATNTAPSSVAISAENLSFTYDDGKDALKALSFNIQGGAVYGIAGHSGSGKSTLLRLLMGVEQYSGSLTLNGRELRDIPLAELRGMSAYVPQECPLFEGSIMYNIKLGNPTASDERIYAAAKAADADEFIRSTPDGYDTLVGENGIKLSGGQRQRIAIARAILKDAPILLLDEVTASLDGATEERIKSALDTAMRGRTTIIVAHRLSTIKDADNIMVLDAGSIVEQGAHEHLLQQSGLYARLYAMQAQADMALLRA